MERGGGPPTIRKVCAGKRGEATRAYGSNGFGCVAYMVAEKPSLAVPHCKPQPPASTRPPVGSAKTSAFRQLVHLVRKATGKAETSCKPHLRDVRGLPLSPSASTTLAPPGVLALGTEGRLASSEITPPSQGVQISSGYLEEEICQQPGCRLRLSR